MSSKHARRHDDAGNRRLPRRPAEFLAWGHQRPQNLGQLLLVATGVVVTVTGPLFADHPAAWISLACVFAGICVVLVVSRFIPWARLPVEATVAMSLAVMLAVAALGLGGDVGSAYTGLLVLCFTYTGLTVSSRVNAWLVLPATVCYLAALHEWSKVIAVRLLIVEAVWILLSQLLCALMVRHESLTDDLRSAANTDLLTGLANRRALDARLAQARPGDTIVLCDLDFFKRFNDTHGHLAGDRLLADFGALLRGRVRGSDFAARYGGEEFAVLLPDTEPEAARVFVERFRAEWSRVSDGVTFSAGLATYERSSGVRETLQAADDALYRAKANGRNQDVHARAVVALGGPLSGSFTD